MLPKKHRMRSAGDFSATVRSGARSGRRNVVLYARLRGGAGSTEPSRVGFIVSKAVGNAVARNLVKRRLRAIMAEGLHAHAEGLDIVVRALPAAAQSGWDVLSGDARQALEFSCRRAVDRNSDRLPRRDTDAQQRG